MGGRLGAGGDDARMHAQQRGEHVQLGGSDVRGERVLHSSVVLVEESQRDSVNRDCSDSMNATKPLRGLHLHHRSHDGSCSNHSGRNSDSKHLVANSRGVEERPIFDTRTAKARNESISTDTKDKSKADGDSMISGSFFLTQAGNALLGASL